MFGFIVDTDQYAGNFERELVAHMTGQIGECEVGEEMVDDKIAEKFVHNILGVVDDHGCHRPASIYENSMGEYNSVIAYFTEKPSPEQIAIMKERAATFNEAYVKLNSFYSEYPDQWEGFNILGFRLVEITTTTERNLDF